MSDVSKKVSLGTCFSIASVWFGSHAGGGFASGNQATQYFVQFGWYAPIMAALAMILLGFVLICLLLIQNLRSSLRFIST